MALIACPTPPYSNAQHRNSMQNYMTTSLNQRHLQGPPLQLQNKGKLKLKIKIGDIREEWMRGWPGLAGVWGLMQEIPEHGFCWQLWRYLYYSNMRGDLRNLIDLRVQYLKSRMRNNTKKKGAQMEIIMMMPFPQDTTLDMIRRIAIAVEGPHSRGLIHKYLNASNIFVDPCESGQGWVTRKRRIEARFGLWWDLGENSGLWELQLHSGHRVLEGTWSVEHPHIRQLWTCMVLRWCFMSYSLISFTVKAIVCQSTSWCCQEEHQSFLITWTLRSPNYCKTLGTWILANGLAGTRSMKSYVQKGVERDLWNPRCTGYSQ